MANQKLNYTPIHPTTTRFHRSESFGRWLVGPLGCGKSFAIMWEIMIRAAQQPVGPTGKRRSRVLLVRNSYRMLTDSVLPILKEVFPEGRIGEWKVTDSTYRVRVNDIECDIMLRALEDDNDIRRVLSINATFCVVEEFREIPVSTVIQLAGRAGRFPAKEDEGCAYAGIFGASNPPIEGSDWHEAFEVTHPAGWDVFKFPSARSPEATWKRYLRDGYYENLMEGGTADYIRVMIDGLYGRSLAGRAVYEKSFTHEFHVAKEPLIPIEYGGHPVIIGMDFGRCYDDKTDVMTEHGWKRFVDVDEKTDRVATLNPHTFALEYTDINFKTEFEYAGEMLEWSGTNLNFCVTPEHVTPYTRRDSENVLRFATAEELAEDMAAHRYIQTSTKTPWAGGGVQRSYVCGFDPMTYARFMGWYLSEGNYDSQHSRVTIAQTKPSTDLLDTLNKTGLLWNEYKKEGRLVSYRCTNRELNQYLKQFGHAHDKRVPDEIRSMPAPFIEAFVMAYTYGDGHLRPPRRGPQSSVEHTVFSVSERMIDGMQELALKLGWASTKRFQKAQTSVMSSGRKIHSAGLWVCSFKKGWTRAELLPAQFQRLNYVGKIYCLNVPYHTLYVRREGKVCWNGNTPAAVFGQKDARGRVLAIDSLYVENVGLEKFLVEHVKPLLARKYPTNRAIVIGDPAGWAKTQMSEECAADVFRRQGIQAVRAPTNDPVKRVAAVEKLLLQQSDGGAMMLFDPSLKHLLRGMNGGYKYKRKQDGTYDVSPAKDEYSHDNDALQYFALGVDTGGAALVAGTSQRRDIERVDCSGWT